MALAAGVFLASCSSDELTNGIQPGEGTQTLKIGSVVTADFGGSSMSISSQSNESAVKRMASAEEVGATEIGYFYVRVDSKVPTTEEEEQGMATSVTSYYPQTKSATDYEFEAMQKLVYPAKALYDEEQPEYLLDSYGLATVEAFAEDAPSMEDVRASFRGAPVTYHGEVVYDEAAGINKLADYKVIWYVVKRVIDYKNVIHVDGALVPKDVEKAPLPEEEKKKEGTEADKSDESEKKIEEQKKEEEEQKKQEETPRDIIIDIDVDRDMVLEADDFAIRKSGVSEYVAYEKVVDANTLEYNGVTITRGSDMKLTIAGLDKLDWSEEGTIWTFETYLWADPENVPATWAMGDDDEEFTIEDPNFDIECHYYKGFQSEGSVPYIKVSVHVSKKVATVE